MSSNSGAKIAFINPSITIESDNKTSDIPLTVDGSLVSVSKLSWRLQKLLHDNPRSMYVHGSYRTGSAVTLRITGAIQVTSDISWIYSNGKRVSVQGAAIAGRAVNTDNGRDILFTVFPHLQRGNYVDASNFVWFDQHGCMVRPVPELTPAM